MADEPSANATTAATTTSPTGETPKPGEASKEAAPDKKAAAAAAAKAGFQAVKGLSKGVAGKFFGIVKGIVSLPLLLFRGDLLTRLLMLGFLASLGLVGLASHRLFQRFVAPYIAAAKKGDSKAGSGMNSYFEQEKELAIATANLVFLDKFSATFQATVGAMSVFEFELFVENDSPETSSIVKARTAEIRELVANAIQGQSYDALLLPEGKEQLKERIADHINKGLKRWTPGGKVKKVYFTKFVMG